MENGRGFPLPLLDFAFELLSAPGVIQTYPEDVIAELVGGRNIRPGRSVQSTGIEDRRIVIMKFAKVNEQVFHFGCPIAA
jgi:hypothetical protein